MPCINDILQTDRHHIWHPYSPLPGPPQHVVKAAKGPRSMLLLIFSLKKAQQTTMIQAKG